MRTTGNPLIYIVDNSSVYRKIVKNCLLALKYENVYSFESLRHFTSKDVVPDILVMENSFDHGEISGMQFMRQNKEKFNNTRFIFLTSDTNLENAVGAIRYGAYDYIVKSKKGLERLVQRIDRLVKLHIQKQRKQKVFNAMVVSLGMFTILFALAIILYNKQIF